MEPALNNHRARWSRRALFAFATVAPVLAVWLWRWHLAIALAPIFISHVLLLYATLSPNCQWWGPVIRSFATSEREVWITIDDGPSTDHTLRMLDILEAQHAQATFFVMGERAEKHPHLITEILARGHGVANHTYTHPARSFWIAGPREIAAEIDRCAPTLRSAPDRPAILFRAPAGLKNPFVHHELRRRGLHLVGWTIRSLDTVRRDAQAIADGIRKKARPGAIILLHESHRTETEPNFNPRCLELTLQELAAAGYSFIIPRVEQLRTRVGGK